MRCIIYKHCHYVYLRGLKCEQADADSMCISTGQPYAAQNSSELPQSPSEDPFAVAFAADVCTPDSTCLWFGFFLFSPTCIVVITPWEGKGCCLCKVR